MAATTLGESLGLDEVRIVVAARQPLKRGGHAAAAEDRASMAELAVHGSGRLRASRLELLREGPSYTVDTLRALRVERPEAELVLLLGADAAQDLPRWYQADAIRALARIEIFSRGGEGGAQSVPRVDISSTEIRARVRQDRSIRYWVPEAVAEYIAAHQLYRPGEESELKNRNA